ncbi:mannose-6-phosphate isomerase, class I [Streptococcus caprae]|uniref:Mannose-6-phosphate isomerase n=1 Tax=Streptococcus caprae TaxID=1640501 RepID=A0ABV8CXA2_9STRE
MQEPIFLESVFQEKIWGGRQMADYFGYAIPSDQTGEFWAISAHPNGPSILKNGPYAGKTLAEVYSQAPELFGYPAEPVFPLLTKIIDSSDWLSVQVHPDDRYAMAHEGELGKTECWYILDAAEGAEIIYGQSAANREELSEKIAVGDWDGFLERVSVKKGDFFYVPSGTVHAIGPGIILLETQQSSDTTYRIYDFDRVDDQGQARDLHIQQSLDVVTYGPVANSKPQTLQVDALTSTLLVTNDYFTVYKWEVAGPLEMTRTAPYLLISVIDGTGQLEVAGRSYPLQKGEHFILPHTVTDWRLEGQMTLIASHTS